LSFGRWRRWRNDTPINSYGNLAENLRLAKQAAGEELGRL
jgi:hypothetical protein